MWRNFGDVRIAIRQGFGLKLAPTSLPAQARVGFSLLHSLTFPYFVCYISHLLLYPQNRVLCGLGNTKFDNGLGGNLDLLLRLWIKTRSGLPLLLYEFPKSRDDEFAILFGRFVGDVAERIEKYSRGPFVGLGGFSKCALKFGFCHLEPWIMPETGDPRHQSSFSS
jgi:hypothetical protein